MKKETKETQPKQPIEQPLDLDKAAHESQDDRDLSNEADQSGESTDTATGDGPVIAP